MLLARTRELCTSSKACAAAWSPSRIPRRCAQSDKLNTVVRHGRVSTSARKVRCSVRPCTGTCLSFAPGLQQHMLHSPYGCCLRGEVMCASRHAYTQVCGTKAWVFTETLCLRPQRGCLALPGVLPTASGMQHSAECAAASATCLICVSAYRQQSGGWTMCAASLRRNTRRTWCKASLQQGRCMWRVTR